MVTVIQDILQEESCVLTTLAAQGKADAMIVDRYGAHLDSFELPSAGFEKHVELDAGRFGDVE